MFSFQTIKAKIEDVTCKDDEGNFIQSDFDTEVESFIDSIMADKKMVRQISFLTIGEYLVAVISYSEMNEQEKKIISAQRSGLTVLEGKMS